MVQRGARHTAAHARSPTGMNERIHLLQQIPVFGGISGEALEFLLSLSRQTIVARGDYFFREGERGSSMFVLESGRADVIRRWEDEDIVLGRLDEGDCFGEMALIDFCRRSASVRAVTDAVAIEISAPALHQLYKKDLEQFALIQMNMGREVSRRLRTADRRLFEAQRTGHASEWAGPETDPGSAGDG